MEERRGKLTRGWIIFSMLYPMPGSRVGDEALLGATPSETSCPDRYDEVADMLWFLCGFLCSSPLIGFRISGCARSG
jgi:hypothetical protein